MYALRNRRAERELHELIAQLAENIPPAAACRGRNNHTNNTAPASLVVQVSTKVRRVIDDLWVPIKIMQRRLRSAQHQLKRANLDNHNLRQLLRERDADVERAQNDDHWCMTNPALEALRTCGDLPRKKSSIRPFIPVLRAVAPHSLQKKSIMATTEKYKSKAAVPHSDRDTATDIGAVDEDKGDKRRGEKDNDNNNTNNSEEKKQGRRKYSNSFERKKEELFDRLEKEWLPETTESVAERRMHNTQDLLEKQGISESAAALREKLLNKGVIQSEDLLSEHEDSNNNSNSNDDGERSGSIALGNPENDGDLSEHEDSNNNSNDDGERSGSSIALSNPDKYDGDREPWLLKVPPQGSQEVPTTTPPAAVVLLPTYGDAQWRDRKRRRPQETIAPPPCERCRRVKRKRMEDEAGRKDKEVNEKVWARWISRPGGCLEFVHADEPVNNNNRHTEFDLDFSSDDEQTQSPPQSHPEAH